MKLRLFATALAANLAAITAAIALDANLPAYQASERHFRTNQIGWVGYVEQ